MRILTYSAQSPACPRTFVGVRTPAALPQATAPRDRLREEYDNATSVGRPTCAENALIVRWGGA